MTQSVAVQALGILSAGTLKCYLSFAAFSPDI